MRASISKRVRPNKRRRRRCARPHPDALCFPPPSPALPCARARPSPPHVWTALETPPRSSRVADASPPRPGLLARARAVCTNVGAAARRTAICGRASPSH
ncbi:unnamed protein product [Chondrus crispus]|uniref:Uncharacterized protein n=1 Tax=Chondrus crispus TaxID=2769 RepID=R7QJW7_CHOCR|nr:unnamed protein product [Chondrus crispus]CDF37771.1 unnamed protein product [Chondrus crispus]|eukprot:XP_005717642.1 unnamed protein product [Chondrus crispus]